MILVKSFTERKFDKKWEEDVEVKEKPLLLPNLRVVVFPDGKITGIKGPGIFEVHRISEKMKWEGVGRMKLKSGLRIEWQMKPNTSITLLSDQKHFGITWVA